MSVKKPNSKVEEETKERVVVVFIYAKFFIHSIIPKKKSFPLYFINWRQFIF